MTTEQNEEKNVTGLDNDKQYHSKEMVEELVKVEGDLETQVPCHSKNTDDDQMKDGTDLVTGKSQYSNHNEEDKEKDRARLTSQDLYHSKYTEEEVMTAETLVEFSQQCFLKQAAKNISFKLD